MGAVADLITTKIETLLGSDYKLFSNCYFSKNYTEARQVVDGDNIGYVLSYNSDYGKFRKNRIVGILTLTNAIRSNSNSYYLSSSYKIQFSVPRNVVKTNKNGVELETAPFDFEDDIDTLISGITNTKIAFDTTYSGKMTMSEPTYISSETDGEFYYDIFEVNGSIVITDNAKFGSDYKVELLVNGEYCELDDVNDFSEVLNTDNNAIVKTDKTRVEQNLAQSGWVCAVTIDDYETTNLARKKIYDIIHLNQEIINSTGESEASKRKIRTRITTPSGVHLFNAILGITFNSSRNGVGNYNISFTDDNKPSGNNYTLSFDSNGGSAVSSKTITQYDKMGTLPKPTKQYFKFVNWTIGGVAINENTAYTYNTNKTAVAVWQQVEFPVPEQPTISIYYTNPEHSSAEITITNPNSFGDVYYTQDSSEFEEQVNAPSPATNGTKYTSVVTINATSVSREYWQIKACVRTSWENSDVTTFNFVLNES